jgi:hypothetical protein
MVVEWGIRGLVASGWEDISWRQFWLRKAYGNTKMAVFFHTYRCHICQVLHATKGERLDDTAGFVYPLARSQ